MDIEFGYQKTYEVELTGTTGLLMHADDISWRDQMEAWQKVPENKKNSRAGDDRTPAWRWLGVAYHDDKYFGIPSDNIMTCIREAGAKMPVGGGKSKETFKKRSQSGIMVNEILWPLYVNGKVVPWEPFNALMSEQDFSKHCDVAVEHGFNLFVKSAKVGQNKHIRVRPRFEGWYTKGSVTVFDKTIDTDVLETLFRVAGKFCGLGDWRPSTPRAPGKWGTFTAKVIEV